MGIVISPVSGISGMIGVTAIEGSPSGLFTARRVQGSQSARTKGAECDSAHLLDVTD